MANHSIAQAIEAITGRTAGPVPAGYRVHGPDPRWVACPENAEQAAALLALAEAEQLAVVPRGGGTRDRLGAPLRQADLVVQTGRLDQVVAYEPADLTVTVQAGITLSRLQQVLGQHGQWLPLDPPGSGASAGGAVAAASSGPRRLAYGSPRDVVLGMKVALTHGYAISCGARVVKNVAGYDLNKLMVGSMGTLGIITEVTFKVRPLPACSRTVLLSYPTLAAAAAAARRVVQSELVPAALELMNHAPAGFPGGPYILAAALEETPAAVAYQEDRLHQLGETTGEVLTADAAAGFWSAAGDPGRRTEPLAALKANLPLEAVPAWMARAEELTAREPGVVVRQSGGAGTGAVRAWLVPAPGAGPEDLPGYLWTGQLVTVLAGEADRLGGSLVVEAAHEAVKAVVDVWGPPGPAGGLMQGLKRRFDPQSVLNPGRFIGGI